MATGWASTLGTIRAQELERGSIDHALDLVVPCVYGGETNNPLTQGVKGYVAPAHHSDSDCADAGLRGSGLTNAPKEGQRLRLNMTDDEIMALDVPDWRKTILRAFAKYGAYVSDTSNFYCLGGATFVGSATTAAACSDGSPVQSPGWTFEMESGAQYTSLGQADPLVTFARRVGLPTSDNQPYDLPANGKAEYTFGFSDGSDADKIWASRLQIVTDDGTQ